MKIDLTKRVHAGNDEIAARLRERLAAAGALCVNLIGSPGAGKTTLIRATAAALAPDLRVSVVVGDLETETDAERLRAAGLPAHQVETLGSCHLEARHVLAGFAAVPPEEADLVIIENVGNLVCPNTWDLGEDAKVALVSLPEGDDKARKYPTALAWAAAFAITKTDLAPHLDADADVLERDARAINPGLALFRLSAKTGEGMDAWTRWLRERLAAKRG